MRLALTVRQNTFCTVTNEIRFLNQVAENADKEAITQLVGYNCRENNDLIIPDVKVIINGRFIVVWRIKLFF